MVSSSIGGPTSVDALARQMQDLSLDRGIKPTSPEKFNGDRTKVRNFITQSRLYFKLDRKTPKDEQPLLLASLLTGVAYSWIEPRIREYLEDEDKCPKSTKILLTNADAFYEQLVKTFGDVNEEQQAERKLQSLKQSGTVSEYTAKFRQVTAVLSWDDAPLAVVYWQGLSNFMKTEITRAGRERDLDELITQALDIDNNWRELSMERKGATGFHSRLRKDHHRKQSNQRWGDPMEIDAVQRKPIYQLTKEQLERKKRGECMKCGKKGHYARECRGGNSNGKQQVHAIKKAVPQPTKRRQVSVVEKDNHAGLHWTACYNDGCGIHMSAKDGAGWYPKKPRKNKRAEPEPWSDDENSLGHWADDDEST